jgi:hypothetical protein
VGSPEFDLDTASERLTASVAAINRTRHCQSLGNGDTIIGYSATFMSQNEAYISQLLCEGSITYF